MPWNSSLCMASVIPLSIYFYVSLYRACEEEKQYQGLQIDNLPGKAHAFVSFYPEKKNNIEENYSKCNHHLKGAKITFITQQCILEKLIENYYIFQAVPGILPKTIARRKEALHLFL